MHVLNPLISHFAEQQGLAQTALFRAGEVGNEGAHGVLLDGAYGTFALSTEPVDQRQAATWAWSANIPHHVSIHRDEVIVRRWDSSKAGEKLSAKAVIDDAEGFYEYLRSDRVKKSAHTVVSQTTKLFREIRTLASLAEMPDSVSIPAYLTMLAALISEVMPVGKDANFLVEQFALPAEGPEAVKLMPRGSVEALLEDFRRIPTKGGTLQIVPQLAIRHASAAIFQEAHHQFEQGAGPDLFHMVGASKPRLGKVVTHFTPATLARSLSEQALERLPDRDKRGEITVGDIACGSGAFLLESLRALERLGYTGKIKLIGRDVSSIAVDMAKFVLTVAANEWPGPDRFTLDIKRGDALQETAPACDVMVMNPPFQSWNDIPKDQRELVRAIPSLQYNRPDLSMAVVMQALKALKPDGVLATLLPANVMEADTASEWRNVIAELRPIALSAIFGEQRLFAHAQVRIGALLVGGIDTDERIEMRVSATPESTSDALRALRRLKDNRSEQRGLYRIDRVIHQGRRSWTGASGLPATASARSHIDTSVKDFFHVQQGIITGYNPAFVLDHEALLKYPPKERAYFRQVVTSSAIDNGQLVERAYIFFPYDRTGARLFRTEDELVRAVPRYAEDRLLPNREKLTKRNKRRANWWELSESRPSFLRQPSLLSSKYFAGPGGFVVNDIEMPQVLQGYGWLPKPRMVEMLIRENRQAELLGAYHALLNSRAFFAIVEENSVRVGGGQFNMSKRYIAHLPLPDLGALKGGERDLVQLLYRFSEEENGLSRRAQEIEEIAAYLLFKEPLSGALEAKVRDLPPLNPAWLQTLESRGRDTTDQIELADTYTKLRKLAGRGAYAEIDAALDLADPFKLAEASSLTLLRGSFPFRTKLQNWTAFRDRVAGFLEAKGAPTKRILAGLYE